jgi:hypothetical protein
MVPFISLVGIPKHVVGITKHVVTTISAFSFTMLLLDRILTHIVNHLSNTSYHLQYLYCQGGYVFGAKPNLIACVAYIFLSAAVTHRRQTTECQGFFPVVRIGSPHPFLRKGVLLPPPLGPRGKIHSLAGERVGPGGDPIPTKGQTLWCTRCIP